LLWELSRTPEEFARLPIVYHGVVNFATQNLNTCMLLLLNSTVVHKFPAGGSLAEGTAAVTLFDVVEIGGGIGVGGRITVEFLPSNIGWRCPDDMTQYVQAEYVEAQSNIKRRDYTGNGSRAKVPAITICNQGLQPLFQK